MSAIVPCPQIHAQSVFAPKVPVKLLILEMLFELHRALNPLKMRSQALGSAKLAVPTWTAAAPTTKYSKTSSAELMPPKPTIGTPTARNASFTRRSVIGLIARPERPPVALPRRDLRLWKSMLIAG